MSRDADAILRAIERWLDAGLVDDLTAAKLRADVAREASAGTRTMSQYIVAITAGTVLLIAAGVFLDWAWPRIGDGARSFALAAAGVYDLRFHDLRHTFASWLIQRGRTLREVQEALGHQTITMTMRYSHLAPDHLRAAVAVLDDVLPSPQLAESTAISAQELVPAGEVSQKSS